MVAGLSIALSRTRANGLKKEATPSDIAEEFQPILRNAKKLLDVDLQTIEGVDLQGITLRALSNASTSTEGRVARQGLLHRRSSKHGGLLGP